MARVSKRFEKRVARYDTNGSVIKSAEGRGISRSQQSLERGRELVQENLNRLKGPMVDMNETTISHKAEALRLIGELEPEMQTDRAAVLLDAALVHSNLAIAEGQERAAEELEDQNHWLEEIANQLSRAQS